VPKEKFKLIKNTKNTTPLAINPPNKVKVHIWNIHTQKKAYKRYYKYLLFLLHKKTTQISHETLGCYNILSKNTR